MLLTQYRAQTNLILNGDFEEYYSCPDAMTQIERCKHVTNPLQHAFNAPFTSTSDYFHGCYIPGSSMEPVGVPNTVYGLQHPRSGEGMVGFATSNYGNGSYNEYFQLSFVSPLICGETYNFSIYFNLANNWKHSRKGLAFYFSTREFQDLSDYLYNLHEPNFVENATLISDTAEWTQVTFDFVADRPYKFVSIGFTESTEDMFIEVNSLGQVIGNGTYFFADDASLTGLGKNVQDEFQLPNVFTPNGDGINDLFTPIGNSSMFEELIVFNRWGNEVARLTDTFIWDGISMGKEMSEGVYFYILKPNVGCENLTKQGMIHLIR
jgi:gliding motility-associated-like protein